ncbi:MULTISPECIES: hypothetical protein [Streptomyces]|uniref:DUF397 domain-containing protein n=1 Tax=Streptomyces canarius TaxID=285453 RepID=A0ABQ3CFN1_9ACTN|nr:hypothetical protein [Streptomyces canarius]GHA08611.1 hypothetical protein GCM10010345_11200 [Streptomyces canarius]
MPSPSYCGICGAPIRWTITEGRKRLAVDAQPHPDGNTAVSRDGRGTWLSRRPTEELPLAPFEKLHMPHVATCTGRQSSEPAARCLGVISLDERRSARGGRR